MGMLNILLKSMSEDSLRNMSRKMERKMDSLDYESKKHTRISTRHIDVVNEIASRSAGKLPNGYTVIGECIGRAQSGTNDNRAEFQKMTADSDKHTFNAVIVYQLDRFARNRYDSAINKAKLKKNGVRVVSERENKTARWGLFLFLG